MQARLLVLRPRLSAVGVDVVPTPEWPTNLRREVDELLARRSVHRKFLSRGVVVSADVDLDPAVDRDFKLAHDVGPHSVAMIAFGEYELLATADASREFWCQLSAAEAAEVRSVLATSSRMDQGMRVRVPSPG